MAYDLLGTVKPGLGNINTPLPSDPACGPLWGPPTFGVLNCPPPRSSSPRHSCPEPAIVASTSASDGHALPFLLFDAPSRFLPPRCGAALPEVVRLGRERFCPVARLNGMPVEPNSRRRPSEVRSLVLSAAERLFAARGFSDVTTDEIATEAGVTRSVLYRHFPTKAALYQAALLSPFREFVDNYRRRLDRKLKEDYEVEQLTRVYCTLFYDSMLKHRNALVSLISSRDALAPEVTAQIGTVFDDFFNELVSIADREAELRALEPVDDFGISIRLILGMVASVSIMDLVFVPQSDRPTREQLIEHLSRFALNGLRLRPTSP
jgi:AcrR family transcriptional regulator